MKKSYLIVLALLLGFGGNVFSQVEYILKQVVVVNSGAFETEAEAIAAVQAAEAVKILSGAADAISPYLLKLNLWSNTVQRIDVARACAGIECPCCALRRFEFLE